MSFVKIWIHAVWTTKKRQPLLSKELRKEVFDHIYQNAVQKEILIECVGGYNNYINMQEKHHKKKTWEEEYNEFIENYRFKIING